MLSTKSYAAKDAKSPLGPYQFERRDLRPHDILIESLYCGVCHSDIHQARNEWGGSQYPMVPGHEIVGKIIRIGSEVKSFKVGDLAGVGCIVDSCRQCANCEEDLEQYCQNGMTGTYNSVDRVDKSATQGGYSNQIVVDENYVLKISPKLDLAKTAPLLCAGITTYSPLKYWNVGPGMKVGVVGLGGLGHMGIKFARAFGAHVVLFTTSENKIQDGLKLGAHEVVLSKSEEQMMKHARSFDFILNTVSANIDLNLYASLLKTDGVLTLVGAPEKPSSLNSFSLIPGRKSIAGSMIGGIKETQEMLDYCAEHNITSEIELIPMQKINEAYDRMLKSDVKYRFVIDLKTL